MLIPAKLVEPELAEAWREACLRDLDRLRWYRLSAGATWVREPHQNGDWSAIARASVSMVDGKPKVLGYCRASMDRECNIVTQLGAWSAAPSVTYARDLRRFCDNLLDRVRLVRFTCAIDNPAAKSWRKWVLANGGVQLCVLEAYGTTEDGKVVDVYHFQVPGRGRK